MPVVRPAGPADLPFLSGHDEHVSYDELVAVVGRGRVLLLVDEVEPDPLGWLRWGLFWDSVPFMNMLHVVETHRGRGLGRLLVEGWETRCRDAGHAWVLTSTMSDERAQHFYRRLGYRDAGALELPGEAPELLFRKPLV
jgi:GNAT superfamily N-acetyltransferase